MAQNGIDDGKLFLLLPAYSRIHECLVLSGLSVSRWGRVFTITLSTIIEFAGFDSR